MAVKQFLVHIDLTQNEIQNAVLQNLATTPAGPNIVGRMYYNTADNKPYICVVAGTPGTWVSFGGDVESIAEASGGAVIVTNGSGPAVTLAVRVDDSAIEINGSDEVTIKADGVVTSHILNNNVTLAKLAQIGSLRILGNLSGGTANVAEVTVETTLTDSDSIIPTSGAVVDAIALAVTSGMTYKGGYNAATNTPDLDSGTPVTIEVGDTYTVTAAGDFFTVAVEVGDMLIAEIDSAVAEADWTIVQRNVDQATETVKGIARLATQAEADTGTDDETIMTPLKVHEKLDKNYDEQSLVSYVVISLVGDDVTTTFPVTHSFTNRDVQVEVIDQTTYETVITGVDRSTDDTVQIVFNTAPATGQNYDAVVHGENTNIT